QVARIRATCLVYQCDIIVLPMQSPLTITKILVVLYVVVAISVSLASFRDCDITRYLPWPSTIQTKSVPGRILLYYAQSSALWPFYVSQPYFWKRLAHSLCKEG